MEEIKQILALSKLLEYSSNLKYGLKINNVSFEDEVGQIAKGINDRIKVSKGLDIFSIYNSLDQIIQYEHFVSNSISNFTDRMIIKRDVGDEIELLLHSIVVSENEFASFKIEISPSIKEEISNPPNISKATLFELIKKSKNISKLPGSDLSDVYFVSSNYMINDKNYVFIGALIHESRKIDELLINSYFLFPIEIYGKYISNPTQLFLKGLDKYGIDMKIGAEISRYYHKKTIPINTRIDNFEFLNLQNFKPTDKFTLSMSLKETLISIELENVFAINKTKLYLDLERYI